MEPARRAPRPIAASAFQDHDHAPAVQSVPRLAKRFLSHFKRGGAIVNSLCSIQTRTVMPRSGRQTRERILEGAYRQFRQKGYTRVSMDEIAAATGVTKRTLYYHFESKDALLAAVLEAQHQLALAAFKTFGEQLSGSPTKDRRCTVQGSCGLGRHAALGGLRLHASRRGACRPAGTSRAPDRAPAQEPCLRRSSPTCCGAPALPEPRQRAREIWLLSEGAISLMLVHGDDAMPGRRRLRQRGC